MAIQHKKILSIAILASLLVFSFTVSSSTAISFAQRDGSSGGGNQLQLKIVKMGIMTQKVE